MNKILWSGVLLLVLIGCSSSQPTDENLDAWTREVRIIEPHQIGERDYEEVANLEEKETISNFGEDAAISTAKERLRRRTAKLDADALVLIDCGRHVRSMEGDDPTRSMSPQVVCQGVAIRWKSN